MTFLMPTVPVAVHWNILLFTLFLDRVLSGSKIDVYFSHIAPPGGDVEAQHFSQYKDTKLLFYFLCVHFQALSVD